MDIGPGGVQIVEPSQTALKYLTEHVKVLVGNILGNFSHHYLPLFLGGGGVAVRCPPEVEEDHGGGENMDILKES